MAENQSQQVLPSQSILSTTGVKSPPNSPPSLLSLCPQKKLLRATRESLCRSMGLVLPQDVKVKAERPIQSLETDAGSELNKKYGLI